ncbi:hypothetical protein Val02_56450 [Virgisporangium aliadipatigenens]|uniref:Uncharacterized protein n=1 Tax=Virgisporangium aliadipatigenens TaxID=741659 RepID=A0A8J4DSJ1_9ACTN|nr:hypothetical protein Val02_56450 [Virgisporangium aliadipatigenens]
MLGRPDAGVAQAFGREGVVDRAGEPAGVRGRQQEHVQVHHGRSLSETIPITAAATPGRVPRECYACHVTAAELRGTRSIPPTMGRRDE